MSVLPQSQAPQPVDLLVRAVLERLLPAIGADGRKGLLLTVFTGATVGLAEAVAQVRALIIAGYRLRLVFSGMAEHLYGPWFREQLAGFPEWQDIASERWYGDLTAAAAIVVPMLSVNSLSRLSLLIADNQAGNLILHGLFAGKPVLLSEDGVRSGEGRSALGFDAGSASLKAAIVERLARVRDLGAVVLPGRALAAAVDGCLAGAALAVAPAEAPASAAICPKTVVGQAEVVAAGPGGRLRIQAGALVTPLARDSARELGVVIEVIHGGRAC